MCVCIYTRVCVHVYIVCMPYGQETGIQTAVCSPHQGSLRMRKMGRKSHKQHQHQRPVTGKCRDSLASSHHWWHRNSSQPCLLPCPSKPTVILEVVVSHCLPCSEVPALLKAPKVFLTENVPFLLLSFHLRICKVTCYKWAAWAFPRVWWL